MSVKGYYCIILPITTYLFHCFYPPLSLTNRLLSSTVRRVQRTWCRSARPCIETIQRLVTVQLPTNHTRQFVPPGYDDDDDDDEYDDDDDEDDEYDDDGGGGDDDDEENDDDENDDDIQQK